MSLSTEFRSVLPGNWRPLRLATLVGLRWLAVIGQTIGVLFLARLYGVPLDLGAILTIVVTVVALTFSIPGVPGGSIVALVPVLLAAGVPVEGVGLLLGVDVLPDMFRTTTNVTGDLALAAIVGRRPRG